MMVHIYDKESGNWTVRAQDITFDKYYKIIFTEYFLYLVAGRPLPQNFNLYRLNRFGAGSNFSRLLKVGDSFEDAGVDDKAFGILCISGGGFGRSETNANQLLKSIISEEPIETNEDHFKDTWDNVRYHADELIDTNLFVKTTDTSKIFYKLSPFEFVLILNDLAKSMQIDDGIDTENFRLAVNKYKNLLEKK